MECRKQAIAYQIEFNILIGFIFSLILMTVSSCGSNTEDASKNNKEEFYSNKNLFCRNELIELGYPFGKYGKDIPLGDPEVEWRRSNFDIKVFLPTGSGIYNGDNEHFLVFEAPKSESLLALWTQSSCEGHGDNHLVLARSDDAENWSNPQYLAGAKYGAGGLQASWGFPIVSEKGRIYIFYSKETELYDNNLKL